MSHDDDILVLPFGGNGFETFLGGLIVETDSEDEYQETDHTTEAENKESKETEEFYINKDVVEHDPDDIVYDETSDSGSDLEGEKREKKDNHASSSSSSDSEEDNVIDYAEDLDATLDDEFPVEGKDGGCGGCSSGCGEHRESNIEPEAGIDENKQQLDMLDEYENMGFNSDFIDEVAGGNEEEFSSEFIGVDTDEIRDADQDEANEIRDADQDEANADQDETNEIKVKVNADRVKVNADRVKVNADRVKVNADQDEANEIRDADQDETNEIKVKVNADQDEDNEIQDADQDEYSGGNDFGEALNLYLQGIP